jgi:hypothetical protein
MAQDDGGYFPYCHQPTSDSGRDTVGNFFRASQRYDCCLYVVDRESRRFTGGVLDITGQLGDPVEPAVGMAVQKMGQTTGRTYGIVKGISNGQFIIDPDPAHMKPGEPVALGGDSGALWVTVPVAGTPRPVGLLIKGKFDPDKSENYSVGLSAPLMARDLGIASFSP